MKSTEEIYAEADIAVNNVELALKDGDRKIPYSLYVDRGFEQLFDDLKNKHPLNETVLTEWFKIAGGYYGTIEIHKEDSQFTAGPILAGSGSVHTALMDKKNFRAVIGAAMGRDTHVAGTGDAIMKGLVNDVKETLNASAAKEQEAVKSEETEPEEKTESYVVY